MSTEPVEWMRDAADRAVAAASSGDLEAAADELHAITRQGAPALGIAYTAMGHTLSLRYRRLPYVETDPATGCLVLVPRRGEHLVPIETMADPAMVWALRYIVAVGNRDEKMIGALFVAVLDDPELLASAGLELLRLAANTAA